jgi:hypothetical protein
VTYVIDGVEYTKQQVWQWLKAESVWKREQGRGVKSPPAFNRAYRRRMGLKRIGR